MYPNHWTENDVSANGVRIHYYRTGAGSGKPALVLVHGFSDNGLCWLPVATALEAEWDIILPDARAHGKSARVKPGEQVDMVADIAGLIQALALQGPVVGGHSMGGSIASQLEARFPGLARALILEDPPFRVPKPAPPEPEGEQPKPPPRNAFQEWLTNLAGKTVEEVMAKGRADNPTWPEIEMPAWAESKLQFDPTLFQTEGTWMEWHEVVRKIACPTLLITADARKKAIVTARTARRVSRLCPSIQVVRIPGAGHNIRRENYPAYMEAVCSFLNQVKRS